MNIKAGIMSLMLLLAVGVWSQAGAVIPQPQTITHDGAGSLVIDGSTRFKLKNFSKEDRAKLEKSVAELQSVVADKKSGDGNVVTVTLDKRVGKNPEGYTIKVTPRRAEIKASSAAGAFYALQTLRQLAADGPVATGYIADEPRFAYRGVMLDVSRHFFDKEHVKRQIDILSRYKFNRLHLHLTDAAGWRLEIEKYPRLTDYAAWRPSQSWKDWWRGGCNYVEKGSANACGGYFTADDIREILSYAADRYVTVIPEIEMPSHSEEVIAAYPELGCTGEVQGEFCIGSEKTFEFLEDVLGEVIDLFPSEYIHIGGDEAPKENWKKCPRCQQRMRDENLQNVNELQDYMIRRIGDFVNSKGRKIIGWDEIVEDGVSPDAAVMCWRGEERGSRAAADGHEVIMTPGGYCYFDSYQDAPYSQPEAIGGYLPLSKVYSYEPVPSGLSAEASARILGVQANLWAEYIPTKEHAEYMLYPRALALAEVGWSAPENKDYGRFRTEALRETAKLRSEGVATFDLASEIGNRPEALEPVEHLAAGKHVKYAEDARYFPGYSAGGDSALVDGVRGGWSYSDKRWQGFTNCQGVDVTIDLGKEMDISYVGADFMQICGPEVFMPSSVDIAVSADGETYDELGHLDHEIIRDDAVTFKNFAWSGRARGRYVRYRASIGQYGGFLFTDEIIVR